MLRKAEENKPSHLGKCLDIANKGAPPARTLRADKRRPANEFFAGFAGSGWVTQDQPQRTTGAAKGLGP
jgi:hypothetical protein